MQLLKFVGCYHGHADSYLVQAGSGVATLGLPDSPGVPAASTGGSPAPQAVQSCCMHYLHAHLARAQQATEGLLLHAGLKGLQEAHLCILPKSRSVARSIIVTLLLLVLCVEHLLVAA